MYIAMIKKFKNLSRLIVLPAKRIYKSLIPTFGKPTA